MNYNELIAIKNLREIETDTDTNIENDVISSYESACYDYKNSSNDNLVMYLDIDLNKYSNMIIRILCIKYEIPITNINISNGYDNNGIYSLIITISIS